MLKNVLERGDGRDKPSSQVQKCLQWPSEQRQMSLRAYERGSIYQFPEIDCSQQAEESWITLTWGEWLGGKWWWAENRFAEWENFLFFQVLKLFSSTLAQTIPLPGNTGLFFLSFQACHKPRKILLILLAQSARQWILTQFIFLFYLFSTHLVFCLCCLLSLH